MQLLRYIKCFAKPANGQFALCTYTCWHYSVTVARNDTY